MINLGFMDEATHLRQQIAALQRRLSEIEKPVRSYVLHNTQQPACDFTIEFDGGTSCNNPSQGFGLGYGSWMINEGPVKKVEFGYGHSCNSAEIRTLVSALRDLADLLHDPKSSTVLVRGDSRIALKWVSCKKHPTKKGTEYFQQAIAMLRTEVAKFKHVRTEWRGRDHSVKLFGH